MDRTIVTGMVEDYWRASIAAMQNGGAVAHLDNSNRFDQRLKQTAALMPPIEASAFLQFVDAERERLMGEYQANPVAFKRRLGIAMGVDAPSERGRGSSSNLGNLVVRTAIRATIWESIWTLFRR